MLWILQLKACFNRHLKTAYRELPLTLAECVVFFIGILSLFPLKLTLKPEVAMDASESENTRVLNYEHLSGQFTEWFISPNTSHVSKLTSRIRKVLRVNAFAKTRVQLLRDSTMALELTQSRASLDWVAIDFNAGVNDTMECVIKVPSSKLPLDSLPKTPISRVFRTWRNRGGHGAIFTNSTAHEFASSGYFYLELITEVVSIGMKTYEKNFKLPNISKHSVRNKEKYIEDAWWIYVIPLFLCTTLISPSAVHIGILVSEKRSGIRDLIVASGTSIYIYWIGCMVYFLIRLLLRVTMLTCAILFFGVVHAVYVPFITVSLLVYGLSLTVLCLAFGVWFTTDQVAQGVFGTGNILFALISLFCCSPLPSGLSLSSTAVFCVTVKKVLEMDLRGEKSHKLLHLTAQIVVLSLVYLVCTPLGYCLLKKTWISKSILKRVLCVSPTKKTALEPTSLRAVDITKSFQNTIVLNKVSCEFKRGSIAAIIGPNGVGKSTFLKILASLSTPHAGFVVANSTLGTCTTHDFKKMPIGICFQESILFEELTVMDTLEFFGTIRGFTGDRLSNSIKNFLALVSLEDSSNKLCKLLSVGQRRKLCICIALIGEPNVILLDEPTANTDVMSKLAIWKLLCEQKQRAIILLTTHSLEEAEMIADESYLLTAEGLLNVLEPETHLYHFQTHIIGDGIEALKLLLSSTNSLTTFRQNKDTMTVVSAPDVRDNMLATLKLLENEAVRNYEVFSNHLEHSFVSMVEEKQKPNLNEPLYEIFDCICSKNTLRSFWWPHIRAIWHLFKFRLLSYLRERFFALSIPAVWIILIYTLMGRHMWSLRSSYCHIHSSALLNNTGHFQTKLVDVESVTDEHVSQNEDEVLFLPDIFGTRMLTKYCAVVDQPTVKELLYELMPCYLFVALMLISVPITLGLEFVQERSSGIMHFIQVNGAPLLSYWVSLTLFHSSANFLMVMSIFAATSTVFVMTTFEVVLCILVSITSSSSSMLFIYSILHVYGNPRIVSTLAPILVEAPLVSLVSLVYYTSVTNVEVASLLHKLLSLVFPLYIPPASLLWLLQKQMALQLEVGAEKITVYNENIQFCLLSSCMHVVVWSVLLCFIELGSPHKSSFCTFLLRFMRNWWIENDCQDHSRGAVLSCTNVSKSYKSYHFECPRIRRNVVLRRTNLAVNEGEVLGILGRNGVGKSSLLRTIVGAEKYKGLVHIRGKNLSALRSNLSLVLGYCPQEDTLWPCMTVLEHLKLFATLKGTLAADLESLCQRLLCSFGLVNYSNSMVKHLSGGTRQKLSYCISMLGSADLRVLDEPSAGLDPLSRRMLWNTVSSTLSSKMTGSVIIATHVPEEVGKFCTRLTKMLPGGFLSSFDGGESSLRSYRLKVKVLDAARSTDEITFWLKRSLAKVTLCFQFGAFLVYDINLNEDQSLAAVIENIELTQNVLVKELRYLDQRLR